MKKLLTISTLCLVIITAILVRWTWSEHRQARKAEAALAEIEKGKPPRFKVEYPDDSKGHPDLAAGLVITVNESGVVKLNSLEIGTTEDVNRLRASLEEIFRERGNHHPSRAIQVKASSRLPYSEVAKVAEAAKGAGADPVGLQVEEAIR